MTLPAGILNESYGMDMAIVRTKTQWVWLGLLIAFLVFSPLFLPNYLVGIVASMGVWVIAALGANITLGYCGQIPIAQSAFMAVGGYTTAILVKKLDISFWWTLPLAAVAAGIVGLIFGIPSFRCKGFYLTLATMAAQILIMWSILRMDTLTNGPFGISVKPLELGPISLVSTRSLYYVILAFVVLSVYLSVCLVRSKVGRAFMAIRDNDISAESLGINVFRYKLLAFFIGCAYAGVAGSLYVQYLSNANVEAFTMWQSIWVLGMVLIGGEGSVSGVIMGVIFVKVIEEVTRSSSSIIGMFSPAMAQSAGIGVPEIVFGLAVVLWLMYDPYGLVHSWQKIKEYYRIWPFAWHEKAKAAA